MKRAHIRDAVSNQKYFFRKEVFRTKSRHPHSRGTSRSTEFKPASSETRRSGTPYGSRSSSPSLLNGNNGRKRESSNHGNGNLENGLPPSSPGFSTTNFNKDSRSNSPDLGPIEDEYSEFSINELINGTKDGAGDSFVGLIPLINNYLDSLNVDIETRCELNLYLDLVSKRASGELMTTAKWIREFVRNHPKYKFDSVVNKEINFDMLKKLDEIQDGRIEADGFLPKGYAERQRSFR